MIVKIALFFEISKRFYKKLKQSYWLFFLVYVCARVYIKGVV